MMPGAMLRRSLVLLATVAAGAALSACGSQPVQTDQLATTDEVRAAELFSRNCGMCHTLEVAGTQGSATEISDRERVDGPNFNVRAETKDNVLYAIRNGGFSGAIMPQNIVTGKDADLLADFLAKYAGKETTSSGGNPASSGGDLNNSAAP
jgi:mono/diheme cytochrome c family protein